MRAMLNEFREFAMKGNMIDMAVGIVIGVAFGAIISSLVDDIIMPPIGLLIGGVDFSQLFVVLSGQGEFNTIEEALEAGAVTWNFGLFLNTVIKFLIIAVAIFFLVKGMNQLMRRQMEVPEEAPPPPQDVELLREIRDLLARRPNP